MLGDLLQAAFGGEQSSNDRLGGLPGMEPLDTSSIPAPSLMPYRSDRSSGNGLDALLPLLLSGKMAQNQGPGVNASGYSAGNALQPNSPLLDTRMGVTLQESALDSLKRRILANITSSYRDPQQQAALYAAKPGIAAPPGSSYHQQGLAIDVNSGWLADHPAARNYLINHGWNQFDASKEPWHFSYGVTG